MASWHGLVVHGNMFGLWFTLTKDMEYAQEGSSSIPRRLQARAGYHPDTQPRAVVVVFLSHRNAPMDGWDQLSGYHHGCIEDGLPNGIAAGGSPWWAHAHFRFPTNQPQLLDGVRTIVPHHRHECFKPNDWKSFYGNVKESIPSNAPELRGKDVDVQLYVDSDHAKVASDLSTHLIALMSWIKGPFCFKKQFQNATTWFFTSKLMTMASAGVIRGKYTPNGSIQWQLG